MFNELSIAYLFFGGTGGGALMVLAALSFLSAGHPKTGRSVPSRQSLALAYGVALGFLTLGIICLVFDLPKPNKAILLFANPTMTHISAGGIALAVCMVGSGALTLFYMKPAAKCSPAMLKAACLLMAVAAAVVIFYPGNLLMSMKKDFVWHTFLIPVLFGLSSLSAGIAVVGACLLNLNDRVIKAPLLPRLLGIDSLVILAKAVATVCYLIFVCGILDSGASNPLYSGNVAVPFWLGFVGCGLFGCIALEWSVRRWRSSAQVLVLLALSLIGAYCLRFSIVGLSV